MRECGAIQPQRVRKIRKCSKSLGTFFMSAREQFVFALLQTLLNEHESELIVCDRGVSVALSSGQQFGRCEFSGFPLGELHAVTDHLDLAIDTMPAVLFVSFLEFVERGLRVMFVQIFQSLLISLAGLWVGGAFRFFLGRTGWGQEGRKKTC